MEAQLRTSKIDFDGKLRAKDHRIRELEENIINLEERLKIGDSRVTGMGGTTHYSASQSGNERMSSSIHSSSSGSEVITPSKTPASQTTLIGRQGGTTSYTATTPSYQTSSYGKSNF